MKIIKVNNAQEYNEVVENLLAIAKEKGKQYRSIAHYSYEGFHITMALRDSEGYENKTLINLVETKGYELVGIK